VGFGIALYTLTGDSAGLWVTGLRLILWVSAFYALWGAISGAVFALALVAAERKRSVAELSMLRVAIWGALGALGLPAGYSVFILMTSSVTPLISFAFLGVVSSVLGAGSAVLTLALARRSRLRINDGESVPGSLTSA
jgi:hypothetical protein